MPSRRTCHVLLILAIGALVPTLLWVYLDRSEEDEGPPPRPVALTGPTEVPADKAGGTADGPLWVRHDPPLETTWPDQPRFTSDIAPRPVPAGELVLLTSSRHDTLTAVAATTGEVRWRFTAEGPVRFAPAVWKDRAYVASDDGFLYCLDLATGAVKWKQRGGPGPRRLLGNERLISTWPARGAPAIAPEPGGAATVYFAAGIWPFMGIFLHALDAETGAVRWSNTGEGSTFRLQPHGGAYAFGGIGPQGSLVVAGDRLLVPGGRSIPACFDRHTGKLLHYRLASDVSRLGGGPDVLLGPGMYFNGPGAFALANGDFLGNAGEVLAVSGTTLVRATTTACRIYDLGRRPAPPRDDKGKPKTKASDEWLGASVATVTAPARPTVLLADGTRIWGAGKDVVFSFDLPRGTAPARVRWQGKLDGTPVHLATSGGRVIVSTREGRSYAFTEGKSRLLVHPPKVVPLPPASGAQAALVKAALTASGAREGYAVVWGAGDGGLVAELLRQSAFRVIVVEPAPAKAAALREALRQADIDGKRASVVVGTPATAALPAYLASLMLSEAPWSAALGNEPTTFAALFRSLRPYGGVACLPLADNRRGPVREWIKSKPGEGQARLREQGELILLSRDGPLPGAADWSHEHADAANTRVSRDERVKAPLGALWFGGPGNQGVLPRHGHGPVPQVVEGRLIIEGTDGLRAIDIYTGRLLWEAKIPGLGRAYDNVAHQPGANAIGSNYVCVPDGIFVAHGDRCLRLDPATGKQAHAYTLPPLEGEKGAPEWTFLSVTGDYLIAGASPRGTLERKQSYLYKKKPREALRGSEASQRLSVLDRRTGRALWSVAAEDGFRHNAICAGNGKLFVIDREPFSIEALQAAEDAKEARDKAKKNGKAKKEKKKEPEPDPRARLLAFDLASGQPLWERSEGVFGTWLSYSAKHDVLVEAGLMARDTLFNEAPGMRAFQGSKGAVLWHKPDYYGPALIHGDRILKNGDPAASSGTACDLRTGQSIQEKDSLTGRPIEWKWRRTYGCNTPAASRHLMLFRSGAAGYYDLCDNGGTGNFGGMRSSCTFNLLPAGGVLTLPDYTRTCNCAYQNQSSLALVHDPEAEMWTFTLERDVAGPIRRLGLNLGAPGGRKADNGTLWLEYPTRVNEGGKRSPRLKVQADPATIETYCLHSSLVAGEGPAWVVASGARGLHQLRVPLGNPSGGGQTYTVKLYFLEPDDARPGERRFDVSLQRQTVHKGLDVVKEAGGPRRGIVRQFKGVKGGAELVIRLTPSPGSVRQETLLSGVEVIAE